MLFQKLKKKLPKIGGELCLFKQQKATLRLETHRDATEHRMLFWPSDYRTVIENCLTSSFYNEL